MADQHVFNIQRLYLKRASLEQPNSPTLLINPEEQPHVEISLDVNVEPTTLRPDIYEVVVDATVQAKIKDKILFLVACKQAGLFEIRNINDKQLEMVLNVACAQIIYPYLRSNITDLIVRGGFTPVNLAEINFRATYEQRKIQRMQKLAAEKQAVQKQAVAPIATATPTLTPPTPAPKAAQKKRKKSSSN
jgi:preprotein translocase subunit SecB